MRHFARCDSLYNFWTPGTPCDETMEELLDQLGSALDPVERKRLSDEVQLHIMNQYQYFPLYWEQEATAWWPEVRGFAHSSPEATDSFRRFFHVWIDPDHKDDKSNRGQTSGPPGGL
jgi:ABC-type transport system substrate-binding protein